MTIAEKLDFLRQRMTPDELADVAGMMVRRHGTAWLADAQVDQIYRVEVGLQNLETALGRTHGRAAA